LAAMNEQTGQGRFILVLGGARSGKSTFAQKLAQSQNLDVTYVACALPIDKEMERRIAKHKESRPIGWTTIEAPYSADTAVISACKKGQFVLWDCVTVFLSNILLDCCDKGLGDDEAEALILRRITDMLCKLEDCPGTLVAVSNEVGLGVVPGQPLGRSFRDIAGRVNQILAQRADKVFFIIAGIPVEIKERGYGIQDFGNKI
jgi:adenosylcobinamide kinase/adenosylcobinamide-phosphate guanylyltransferase